MNNARAAFVGVFGSLIALVGMEHGTGEFLQGRTRPRSMVIRSWPDSGFFRILDGEPAFTVIPDMRLAGIATLLVCLALLVYVWRFRRSMRVGLGILALSGLLFLTGGGFGPPFLGLILGLAVSVPAARARETLPAWRVRLRKTLAETWPLPLAGCVVSFLVLMPGLPLLDHLGGIYDPALVVAAFLSAMTFLAWTIASVRARDAGCGARSPLKEVG